MYRPQTVTANSDGSLSVHDPLWGKVILNEPVVVSLIQTPAMQRLSSVLQSGITGLINMLPPVTRLEHSIGAMLLVGQLKGSLKEQVAALLHDVSHTALSHVVDHAFRGESFHEVEKENYIERTELVQVLAEFGYNWRDFLCEDAFGLLERPSPNLCADRVDYGLRDAFAFGILTQTQVEEIVGNFTVGDGCIVFRDARIARVFAEAYMAVDRDVYTNIHHVGLYELTGSIIRDAVQKGIVTKDHLWRTDSQFWSLLSEADSDIRQRVAMVSSATRFEEVDESSAEFVVKTKTRTVDPGVLRNGSVLPLSQLDAEYKQIREQYLGNKNRVFKLRICR